MSYCISGFPGVDLQIKGHCVLTSQVSGEKLIQLLGCDCEICYLRKNSWISLAYMMICKSQKSKQSKKICLNQKIYQNFGCCYKRIEKIPRKRPQPHVISITFTYLQNWPYILLTIYFTAYWPYILLIIYLFPNWPTNYRETTSKNRSQDQSNIVFQIRKPFRFVIAPLELELSNTLQCIFCKGNLLYG